MGGPGAWGPMGGPGAWASRTRGQGTPGPMDPGPMVPRANGPGAYGPGAQGGPGGPRRAQGTHINPFNSYAKKFD